MSTRFYNTKSRKKEIFVPIKKGHVNLYTCGPTVYDTAHIGNFRTFIFEDLLKRYLLLKGYGVTHVMNLTDVDDKTIKKSVAEKIPIRDLTNKYIDLFHSDIKKLKIIPADHYPRATDHIAGMIEMIKSLIEREFAYITDDGSVYFSISTYADYGRLANLNFELQQSTERVETDDYSKDNPQDFTLWKAWKDSDGEVFWDSPWGRGRPGWHIECSAMSVEYLGNHFDIHCGGVDNLFPHHENEIAQSVCATGKEFVNYWLHSEHLLLDSEKMSKSLGNFYHVKELLAAGYTSESLRYALLSTHYRSKLKFTNDKKHEAQKAVSRVQEIYNRLQEYVTDYADINGSANRVPASEDFIKALDDDLDVAGALSSVFDWIRKTNVQLDTKTLSEMDATNGIAFLLQVNSIFDILKFDLSIPEEIIQLAKERTQARKNRDWQNSDRIRDELYNLGWNIEDTPAGAKLKQR
ncbi:MAG: cysteine--tRNA ligase [Candidatus Marinimicrobia bacterium]|nr:cysteine--tRNA ligase [Candidatus Neomarinimicrobiota bacterium]